MQLYRQLPTIQYFQRNAVNLVTRAAIHQNVLAKYQVFYPYRVGEGERPDTIAADYYKASTFDWLVLLSNNITNPYTQWPKTQNVFLEYLKGKYGSVESTMTEIHHYKYTLDEEDVRRITYTITPETYEEMTVSERYGWQPVYTYEWEQELNEAKRDIRLISNIYISQIQSELASLFI